MFLLALGLALANQPTTEAPAAPEDHLSVPSATSPEALAPWSGSFPGRVTEASPHYDLEVLYFQEQYDEGLAQARSRMAADPKDVVPYWMAARFLYEIGERFSRSDASVDKVAHYKDMIAVAEAGLEHDPDNVHLWFARGIGYGRLGTTRGVLASLFLAKDVESSWKKTIDLGVTYAAIGDNEFIPCDAHQALAVYYRLVPESWLVKMIAGTRGDLEASLEHAEAAVACSPGVLRSQKELGVSQLCLGERRGRPELVEAGRATLTSALDLPVRKASGKIDKAHIRMLLDDPSLACEYSRDGQQDLDESQLED